MDEKKSAQTTPAETTPAQTTPAQTTPADRIPIQPKRKKSRYFPADKTDKWMAVWMFFVAYMAVEWFWIGTNHAYYGLGVFCCTMVYGLTVLVYAGKTGHRIKAEGIFWFAVMGLCGFSYVWVYNQSLMRFLALFLRLVSLYAAAVVFETLTEGKTGDYFIVDGVQLLIMVPFKNLLAQSKIVGRKLNQVTLTKEILHGLAGCLAAIPLLALIIRLLSVADDNFAWILTDSFRYVIERWSGFLWTGVLALPIGAFLYGQMYGCARRRGTDAITAEKVKKHLKVWAVIPVSAMFPALAGVVILYLVFIGLQGSYYLDGLRGVLPEGVTYSRYARQGFFELVAVCIINLAIICLAQLLYQRKAADKKETAGQAAAPANRNVPGRFLKYHTVVLSLLTLFLIATAMTKMFLYIQVYGLTPLRVIPSVFMVFLAMVFLLTAASRFIRVPVMRISVWVFAAGFTVMALCGMDGKIAACNLARYEAGTLGELPRETLENGHFASALPMYQVWSRTEDEKVKRELEEIASGIYLDYSADYAASDGFFNLNRERQAAIEALREMGESWEQSDELRELEEIWEQQSIERQNQK